MRKAVLAAAALVTLNAVAVQAQTASVAVSVEIPTIMAITSTGSFTFPAVTEAAYAAAQVESTGGPTLTHRANVPYRITVSAQSGTAFGYTPAAGRSDADPNKPFSDLELLANFGGTAVAGALAAPGSPTEWFSRASRGAALSGVVTARLALDWANDPPGTYATTVVFTMVAQ